MEDITEKKLVAQLKLLVKELSRVYEVDMLSKSRRAAIVIPRQAITAIIYKELNITKKALGDIFGQNHASAINSIKAWENSKGLPDKSSRTMQEYYDIFLPYVRKFKAQMLEGREKQAEIILEGAGMIEQRISKMEKMMSKQMLQIIKISEDNSRMINKLSAENKRKEEYKAKYEALKRDYELLAPSRQEQVELERLKSYVQ